MGAAAPRSRRIPTTSARRFDARFRRPSERTSKSTDSPRRICAPIQRLKNPYCLGEVRSFGEKGRRDSDFGPSRRLRRQQLFAQKRAFPGVFRRCGRRRRPYRASGLAEGVGFEPTVPGKGYNGFRDRPVRPLRHPSAFARSRLARSCAFGNAGALYPSDESDGDLSCPRAEAALAFCVGDPYLSPMAEIRRLVARR